MRRMYVIKSPRGTFYNETRQYGKEKKGRYVRDKMKATFYNYDDSHEVCKSLSHLGESHRIQFIDLPDPVKPTQFRVTIVRSKATQVEVIATDERDAKRKAEQWFYPGYDTHCLTWEEAEDTVTDCVPSDPKAQCSLVIP